MGLAIIIMIYECITVVKLIGKYEVVLVRY